MLIYFAAPLFCQAERDYNFKLVKKLEKNGYTVFLPQRDGVELKENLVNTLSEEDLCQKIFKLDRSQILKADIFLMILDGRVPDDGACVELGIAHENKLFNGKKKLLVGFSTDMRTFAEMFKLNAMILGALDFLVNNEADLFMIIKEFQEGFIVNTK